MERVSNINEALTLLKDREILTTVKKDKFILKNNHIYRYFNSNSYCLTLDDFKDLYKDEQFFIFEENNTYIDDQKDEAYYRYYRK